MIKVALTGGIGSGKSEVEGLLAARGATVVDADALAREVVAPGTPGLAAVLAEFGPTVRAADGSLPTCASWAKICFTMSRGACITPGFLEKPSRIDWPLTANGSARGFWSQRSRNRESPPCPSAPQNLF